MVKTYEGFYRYLHVKCGTKIGQHLYNESYRVEQLSCKSYVTLSSWCYGDVVRPDTGMTIGSLVEMYLSYDVCALDCVGIAVSSHVTCVI